jgi:hypothetical protein
MKATQTNNYMESQRELSAGVLKQAEQDLQRFHTAPSAIERELYLDAYRWLMSDDSTWPFSFLNVCQSLNLVPEDVRHDLTGQVPLGTFSRWLRHCARAVQRFQMLLSSASPAPKRVKVAESVALVQTLH